VFRLCEVGSPELVVPELPDVPEVPLVPVPPLAGGVTGDVLTRILLNEKSSCQNAQPR